MHQLLPGAPPPCVETEARGAAGCDATKRPPRRAPLRSAALREEVHLWVRRVSRGAARAPSHGVARAYQVLTAHEREATTAVAQLSPRRGAVVGRCLHLRGQRRFRALELARCCADRERNTPAPSFSDKGSQLRRVAGAAWGLPRQRHRRAAAPNPRCAPARRLCSGPDAPSLQQRKAGALAACAYNPRSADTHTPTLI